MRSKNINEDDADDKFLKIVKNITSKGFVRSYKSTHSISVLL